MDTFDYQNRIQTRFSHASASDKSTLTTHSNQSSSRGRDRGVAFEECDSKCKPSRRRPGILQPLLSGSKEIRRFPPDIEPHRIKQIRCKKVVSHGIKSNSSRSGRTARVAGVDRFEGRVFSYRDPHRIPAILPVRSKRQAVPIYCAPVRTSKRTSCVYPNSGHSSSRATPTSRKATSVSGRLVAKGHSQGGVMSTPPKCVDVISPSRVYSEYGEIVNSPKPRHGFRGNATPHQRRSSFAHTRQSGQIITDYAPASRKSCSYGAPTVDPVRDHGFRNRYRPVGETSSAPNPTLFAGAMETEPRPIVSHSSNTPSFTFTLNVVDERRKFSQGDTITSVPSRPISVHGCLPPRVGGTSRSPPCCRDVVDTTPAVPHQLARTTGGIFIPQTVRGSCNQPPRVSQYRQHDGGCLHQQNGGDAFPNPVLPVVGPDVLVYAPRDNTPCQTPTGQKEPHSGCVISQPPSSSNRMDTSTGSSQSGVSPLGNPHDGLVCDVRESQTPTVRLPHPRSSGNGGGRAINTLGRDGRIRVPPDPINPSRSEQDSERGHGSNNDSTPMAEQIMVSSAVGSDSRSTPRTSVSSGLTVTRSRPDPSGPKSVPLTRIQVVEQSLSTQGFSRAAAAVIARPQRASTLATYEHKWQKFSDWCNGRKINPLNINESQLADFLLHLFTIKKFAPRSIAVYRTAISATIKNLGGENFGHNSRLSAMIKHFMVERPPTRKLVPQWSLSLVLRALREPPFEPMDSISFKALTYKTVFLLALASGRRRSELHALGVSDGLVKLSKTEVVLRTTPGFLAKNQVAGSVAAPITIKALSNLTGSDPQEVTLCPVRAIRWYLSRTKSRRDGNMRFFLPLSKKADCSAADISKWICGTISWAHSECSEHQRGLARVSAHEVRAIATSTALLSGVPLDEILQAGTWRSSNSFVSFYLRDMASELDGLHSLGPISVSQSII